MQHLEVSGAVRHIYIYVIRRLRVNHINRLCNSVEVKNWAGCSQFRESITDLLEFSVSHPDVFV